MKTPLFVLVWLLLSFGAKAQIEAKLHLFSLQPGSPKFALEGGLSKRLGLEAGVQFIKDGYNVDYELDSTRVYYEIDYRKRHYYTTLKYYFSKEKKLTGGYTGIRFYYEHFTNYKRDDAPAPAPYDNRALALELGSKWLIWKKMVLELGGAIGYNYEKGLNLNLPLRYRDVVHLEYEILLKLGYRF